MPTYNSRIDSAVVPPAYGGAVIGGVPVSGEDIFSSRYHNIASPTSVHAPFPLCLGAAAETPDNRVYRYVKANVAISLGHVVKMDSGGVGLLDLSGETAVAYDLSNLKLTFPNSTMPANGSLIGTLLVKYTAASGGGALETRVITQNLGKSIYIDRPLGSTPAAAADYYVTSPWVVILGTAAAKTILGVASVGAIASGNFGWVQTKGTCEAIQSAAVTWGTGDYIVGGATGFGTNTGAAAGASRIGFFVGLGGLGASTAGDLVAGYLELE